MTRNDVTELVVFNRMKKGITWASLAEACGKSVPWTTSALLGQHQMSPEQATTAGKMLDLPDDAVMLLQHVPYKGNEEWTTRLADDGVLTEKSAWHPWT